MMNNNDIKALFPIEELEEKRLVDARVLHQFLEVGTHFREWIRRRIKSHRFIEGEDYSTFVTKKGKTQMGRPPKTYALTLGMAKELTMIEHNERGLLHVLEFHSKKDACMISSFRIAPIVFIPNS